MLSHLILPLLLMFFASDMSDPQIQTADTNATYRIIIISDTQQPMWVERLYLESHRNRAATSILFATIAADTSNEAVYHLGDFTSIGMMSSYWEPFDQFQAQLKPPVYPLLGNHDYYFIPSWGLAQFRKRFPSFTSSWYMTRIGPLAIISLNSNFTHLSFAERSEQHRWYQTCLDSLEQDESVLGIIVMSHHPPFTQSTIVSPDEDVQHDFVRPFLEHEKCKLFLSGHAHAYEHFRSEGKDFLVIGGGGGLLHPLNTNGALDTMQVYHGKSYFHYVECTVGNHDTQVRVHMLNEGFVGFTVTDSLRFNY